MRALLFISGLGGGRFWFGKCLDFVAFVEAIELRSKHDDDCLKIACA